MSELPAALRAHADETVDRLLRENEPHWRSLSDADRRTVELLARTVASRLLDRLSALDAGDLAPAAPEPAERPGTRRRLGAAGE